MNLEVTGQINFTCDTFETYPSKKPPFFSKEQLIYITSCKIWVLNGVLSALLALVSKKIALGNNVCYRMWELTDVLSDYLHYWHWSARK
ncbi:hypothetical protein CDAR_9531 [Caerostris darwini]|uniref:Uncharacterized protein n=1 Tax=Caerostris darwini TaxID=1538125 RepID=A0AAV4T825_9ARAC|nr:hypothetical protein CDAR_9531 [Caerostris darwini]